MGAEIAKTGAEAGTEGNYTYLLRCADGSLYCGWTPHLLERVRRHKEGKGAKYTRSRRPVELVYYEVFPTKREAMRREWVLKQMSRAQKLELIREGGPAVPAAGLKQEQISCEQ